MRFALFLTVLPVLASVAMAAAANDSAVTEQLVPPQDKTDPQIAARKLWSKACTQAARDKGPKVYVYEVFIDVTILEQTRARHTCKHYDEERDTIVNANADATKKFAAN